jgi:hypothetical protein
VGLPQDLLVHFLAGQNVPNNPFRMQIIVDFGLPEETSAEELREVLMILGLVIHDDRDTACQ